MTLQNFRVSRQPLLRFEEYRDIFSQFYFDTWFFHYWSPHRKWNDPEHKWWIGMCLFGKCIFMAIYLDDIVDAIRQ